MVYILYFIIKNTYKAVYVCYVWISVCYAATECNINVNIIFGSAKLTLYLTHSYVYLFIISSSFFSQPEMP